MAGPHRPMVKDYKYLFIFKNYLGWYVMRNDLTEHASLHFMPLSASDVRSL